MICLADRLPPSTTSLLVSNLYVDRAQFLPVFDTDLFRDEIVPLLLSGLSNRLSFHLQLVPNPMVLMDQPIRFEISKTIVISIR
jgi:hypothetical protein